MSVRLRNWKYLDHKGSGGNDYDRDDPSGMKQYAIDVNPNSCEHAKS